MSECYRLTGHPELAEIADLVVNSDSVVEPEETEAEPHLTVHFAVVPLALVGQALKQLLSGIRQIKDATGETTEGQSAAE